MTGGLKPGRKGSRQCTGSEKQAYCFKHIPCKNIACFLETRGREEGFSKWQKAGEIGKNYKAL